MDLAAVHAMQAKAVVAGEGLTLCVKPLAQQGGQIGCALAPDVAHGDEHRVLHRRVVDGPPVPDPEVD